MVRPKRKARPWKPVTKSIVFRETAGTLANVQPLLVRLIEALGTNAAARLLGADRAQVSRWMRGKEQIGEARRRQRGIVLEEVNVLSLDYPAFQEAGTIVRRIIPRAISKSARRLRHRR